MKTSREIKYKNNECPICLQKIKYKIKTGCGHSFCDKCIVKYLLIKNTCPMCRTHCDFDYIVYQIKPKRQRRLLNPIPTPSFEPVQQINIFPQHFPGSIVMIIIFIVELYILTYSISIVYKIIHCRLRE